MALSVTVVRTAARCRSRVYSSVTLRLANSRFVYILRLTMEHMQDPALEEASERVVDEVDRARAQEYALLATLLLRSPDAQMISRLALLRGDASPLGVTHAALGEAAVRANAEGVKREYSELFDGIGHGGLLPYASYYLTGSLYGPPLARLRETLRRLRIEGAAGHSEPEDHAAILCGIMAGLVGGHIAAPAEVDRAIFEKHLAPWIGRFFADLERVELADFYACVGAVGRAFVDIETEAFALPA
jgi:TorA maturation chaperone TorD